MLPIGFAIKKEDRYSESWSYNIIPERLIAYNHGRINEIQVKNIEKSLSTIIKQFEEMKHGLVFLLKENEELEGQNSSWQSLHQTMTRKKRNRFRLKRKRKLV